MSSKLIIVNRALTGRPPPPHVLLRIASKSNRPGRRIESGGVTADPSSWMDHAINALPQWVRGLAGATLWGALHRRALARPARVSDAVWLATFRGILPCGGCRKHWDAMLAATPPDWSAYFAWTVARHNEVNRRLGKPEMGLEEALQRWSGAPATAVQSSEGEAPREG